MKLSNESTSWKLVRFLGVGSLFAASYYLLQILIFTIFYLSAEPMIVGVDTNGIQTRRLPNINWDPIINFAFFMLWSVYFFKFGKLAHKLINASK